MPRCGALKPEVTDFVNGNALRWRLFQQMRLVWTGASVHMMIAFAQIVSGVRGLLATCWRLSPLPLIAKAP